MDIENLEEPSHYLAHFAGKPQKTKKSGKQHLLLGRFREALSETTELGLPEALAATAENLQKLWDGVHESADNLSKQPYSSTAIAEYKASVRGFMSYVVQNGLSVEHIEGAKLKLKKADAEGNRYRRHSYSQVQVVDQSLEKMADALLSGQMKQLELLEAIDEIKGLLVDLLVGD
jgi:uncharacterized protein YaaR (DUF327 family)